MVKTTGFRTTCVPNSHAPGRSTPRAVHWSPKGPNLTLGRRPAFLTSCTPTTKQGRATIPFKGMKINRIKTSNQCQHLRYKLNKTVGASLSITAAIPYSGRKPAHTLSFQSSPHDTNTHKSLCSHSWLAVGVVNGGSTSDVLTSPPRLQSSWPWRCPGREWPTRSPHCSTSRGRETHA